MFRAVMSKLNGAPLRGQFVYFVNCKRIPQRGPSLCSAFDISFSLIVPTKIEQL